MSVFVIFNRLGKRSWLRSQLNELTFKPSAFFNLKTFVLLETNLNITPQVNRHQIPMLQRSAMAQWHSVRLGIEGSLVRCPRGVH